MIEMLDFNTALPGRSEENVGTANIKVVGVGGGGQNAVNRMYRERVPEVEYISVNTDAQALDSSVVPVRLRVGDNTARGLGVGGDPSKGRQCLEEDRDEIVEILKGADLVFVAAGMGGGTGTGGAPVVAEVAQDTGALTVGVVTKPFAFEGAVRKKKALEGIEMLRDKVDTLIVIPNDRLMAVADEQLPMDRAFKMADDVLSQGIRSIAELIIVPGEINLDFADVRAVMDNAGPAWMAIGKGTGPNRAIEAAEQAINSPLLEIEIAGAKGVVFNITGGTDLTLDEVQRASEVIASTVHPDANIIFGTVTDPKMENEVKLTIIATGFPVAAEIQEQTDSVARKALEDPASMAIPPFLRHHPAARKRYRNCGMYRDAEEAQPEETPVLADD
ncbi:MAG TPA: cell division protein FtsZ [Dehalococcoidia bacterium]|nr:cell division protein FtsZ [Dehalococcoidia bacterium]